MLLEKEREIEMREEQINNTLDLTKSGDKVLLNIGKLILLFFRYIVLLLFYFSGGQLFATYWETLVLQSKYFKRVLSSKDCKFDKDGQFVTLFIYPPFFNFIYRFFIDRNPKLFGIVLDYLRNQELKLDYLTTLGTTADLVEEFKFYEIPLPKGYVI